MPKPESHATGDGNNDMFTLKGMRGEDRLGKIKNAGTIRETRAHEHPFPSGENRKHVPTLKTPSISQRTIFSLRELSHKFRSLRKLKRDR